MADRPAASLYLPPARPVKRRLGGEGDKRRLAAGRFGKIRRGFGSGLMRMRHFLVVCFVLASSLGVHPAGADGQKLRIISWADYVPADLIAAFKKETGIDVELTLSNNEEMISKLRATGGAGYDLAQPSQDRIVGAQREFGIYKPLDLSKIKTDLFIPSMLDATKKNTTLDGKVYGLPHIWGTDGLVVNTKVAGKVADYPD